MPSDPYLCATECLDLLQLLLAEFSDMFNTLSSLSLARSCGHRIPPPWHATIVVHP